jgi:hypothetical protein
MYYITNNFQNFINLINKDEAIRLADMVRGFVFIVESGQNNIIYSHN